MAVVYFSDISNLPYISLCLQSVIVLCCHLAFFEFKNSWHCYRVCPYGFNDLILFTSVVFSCYMFTSNPNGHLNFNCLMIYLWYDLQYIYVKTFFFSHKMQDLVTAIHNGTGAFLNDVGSWLVDQVPWVPEPSKMMNNKERNEFPFWFSRLW